MKSSWLRQAIVVAFIVAAPGCFASGHSSGPWEWGGGIRIAPGWPVGNANLTAHPMLSYTYLSFDGGHDSLWELGGQVRKPIASGAEGGRAFWLGAEGALSYLNTVGGRVQWFGFLQ